MKTTKATAAVSETENPALPVTTPGEIPTITSEQYEALVIASLTKALPDDELKECRVLSSTLTILGPTDKDGYKAVQQALTRTVKLRTGIEATRKALKEPTLKLGKAIDAKAKELTAIVTPIEALLEEKKAAADAAIEAERKKEELRLQAIYEARVNRLTDIGFQFNTIMFHLGMLQYTPDKIKAMDDEAFLVLCQKGQEEADLLKAAQERERKQQEEAIQKAQEAEEARLKAEQEAEELRRQLAEFQAKQAAQEAQQPTAPAPVYHQPTAPPPPPTAYYNPEPAPYYPAPPIPDPAIHPQAPAPAQPTVQQYSDEDIFQQAIRKYREMLPYDGTQSFERGFDRARWQVLDLIYNAPTGTTRSQIITAIKQLTF